MTTCPTQLLHLRPLKSLVGLIWSQEDENISAWHSKSGSLQLLARSCSSDSPLERISASPSEQMLDCSAPSAILHALAAIKIERNSLRSYRNEKRDTFVSYTFEMESWNWRGAGEEISYHVSSEIFAILRSYAHFLSHSTINSNQSIYEHTIISPQTEIWMFLTFVRNEFKLESVSQKSDEGCGETFRRRYELQGGTPILVYNLLSTHDSLLDI